MIIFNICFGYIVWSHNIPEGYCVSSSCRYDMHVQYACHANENKPKLINHHKHQTSNINGDIFTIQYTQISEGDKTQARIKSLYKFVIIMTFSEVMSSNYVTTYRNWCYWKKRNHLITKLSNHSKFGWGGFFFYFNFFPLCG